jgi:protein-export membrane protein SecD
MSSRILAVIALLLVTAIFYAAACAPKMETQIVLEPDTSMSTASPENVTADTITVIETRVNSLGISGAIVSKQDDGSILLQLPKVEDIDQVVALITTKGELDFRELVVDDNDSPVLDDKGEQQWTIARATGSNGQEEELTGKYLKPNAQVVLNPRNNAPEVEFEWNSEGTILFEQITERNLDKPLGIFLDNKLISAPTVKAVIKDKGVITGLTLEDAKALAIQLNSGALPVTIRVVSIEPNGKD